MLQIASTRCSYKDMFQKGLHNNLKYELMLSKMYRIAHTEIGFLHQDERKWHNGDMKTPWYRQNTSITRYKYTASEKFRETFRLRSLDRYKCDELQYFTKDLCFPITIRMSRDSAKKILIFVRNKIFHYLEKNAFIKLLEVIASEWAQPIAHFREGNGKHKMTILRSFIKRPLDHIVNMILHWEKFLDTRETYRVFYEILRLGIAPKAVSILNRILATPEYLTAGDCICTMKQFFIVLICSKYAHKRNTHDEILFGPGFPSLKSIAINDFSSMLSRQHNSVLKEDKMQFILRFGEALNQKIDELTPPMCYDAIIICTVFSKTTFQDTKATITISSLTANCFNKVVRFLSVNSPRYISPLLVKDMFYTLTHNPRQKVFKNTLLKLVAYFLDANQKVQDSVDLHDCLAIIKALYLSEVDSQKASRIFMQMNKCLTTILHPQFSVQNPRARSNQVLGLSIEKILEVARPLAFYESYLLEPFKLSVVHALRRSMETALPITIIQCLHRLSNLPKNSFLATTELLNALISKAHTVVYSLTPLSLTLLYNTLSKLNSRHYVHAIISSLNSILVEIPLSSFDPREITTLLESMARVASMVRDLSNMHAVKHNRALDVVSNFIGMFSNDGTSKASGHIILHVAQNIERYSSMHLAIILNSSTFLCSAESSEQILLYDAACQHILQNVSSYSQIPAKEIVVLISSFHRFSYTNTKVLDILSIALTRLRFFSESEIADIIYSFSVLNYTNLSVLRYSKTVFERTSSMGYRPVNVCKAFTGFAHGGIPPPPCLIDFVQCYPQLFDHQSRHKIQKACEILKLDNLFDDDD